MNNTLSYPLFELAIKLRADDQAVSDHLHSIGIELIDASPLEKHFMMLSSDIQTLLVFSCPYIFQKDVSKDNDICDLLATLTLDNYRIIAKTLWEYVLKEN